VYEKEEDSGRFRGSSVGAPRVRGGGRFNSIYAAAPGVTREE